MKRFKFASMLVFASILILTSAYSKPKEKPDDKNSAKPDTVLNPLNITPSPFAVPKEYNEEYKDYRHSWSILTGFEFSGLHWNQYIVLFVNKEPSRYINNYTEYVKLYKNQDLNKDENDEEEEKHFEPYTLGTIFLKEHYLPHDGKPKIPTTITSMIKRKPGYDSASGDWQYLQWGTDGKII